MVRKKIANKRKSLLMIGSFENNRPFKNKDFIIPLFLIFDLLLFNLVLFTSNKLLIYVFLYRIWQIYPDSEEKLKPP